MQDIATHFTWIDWLVVAAYLGLTTLIGERLKGKQSTIQDFFLAGRSLPWPAVAGSIIATEISALTFIGVPGLVFAAGGDLTYLQWAIGSIAARFIVGLFFVQRFYQDDIYSPYDYMAQRLGPGIKVLTTCLFFVGSILGQSVRLLVTAIVLRVATGMDYSLCIFIIGAFAVLWTWMGGMTTVIWTDVIQFLIFLLSGVLALLWILFSLEGGAATLIQNAADAGKLRLINLSTDPTLSFTLWVAFSPCLSKIWPPSAPTNSMPSACSAAATPEMPKKPSSSAACPNSSHSSCWRLASVFSATTNNSLPPPPPRNFSSANVIMSSPSGSRLFYPLASAD
ncbi:MAG: hypothetical protein HC904_17805 [Blastochloris sp.]|nr:hypothetical protein [Blastochloris sp.]